MMQKVRSWLQSREPSHNLSSDEQITEPDHRIGDAIKARIPDATRDDISRIASAMERVHALFPRVPRVVSGLLQNWSSANRPLVAARDPLLHFAYQQILLWIQDVYEKMHARTLLIFDLQDMFISLYECHAVCLSKSLLPAQQFAGLIRQLSIYLSELCSLLAKLSHVEACDILRLGDLLFEKMQQYPLEDLGPSVRFIPKVADFVTEKVLGSGAFGVVYKARYLPANMVCTLKIVSTDVFSVVEHIVADRVTAAMIDHPLLVVYHCVFSTETATITMMEYLKAVDVQKVVDKARNLRVEQARIIFAQMVAALMHMHYNGLIHRDIKGSNALIGYGGKVKLIDFDTSKVCIGHFGTRYLHHFFRKTATEIDDGEKAGTYAYMSPEVVSEKAYGRSMDWWSMGVTLFKLMIGRVPFRSNDEKELQHQICYDEVKFPRFKANKAQTVYSSIKMMRGLLKKKPSERLGSVSYQEILESEFLAPIDWNWLLTADQLLKLPCFGKIMNEQRGSKSKQRFSAEQMQEWSPEASVATKQRQYVKLQELEDKRTSHQLLFTYVSSTFRESVRNGMPAQISSGVPMIKTIRKHAPTQLYDLNSTKNLNPLQAERVDIAVLKARSARLGIELQPTPSDGGRIYYVITHVSSNDPTALSGLLEGDVVTAINGVPIIDATEQTIETLISSTVDEVFVSVLSSNVIRAMQCRVDMHQVLMFTDPVEVTYSNPPVSSEILVRLVKYYDLKTRSHMKAKVLFYVPLELTCEVYVGDVILAVNGIPAIQMTPEELQQHLRDPDETLVLTIIPVSGLRNERLFLDRLLRTYDGSFVSVLRESNDLKPLVDRNIPEENDSSEIDGLE